MTQFLFCLVYINLHMKDPKYQASIEYISVSAVGMHINITNKSAIHKFKINIFTDVFIERPQLITKIASTFPNTPTRNIIR